MRRAREIPRDPEDVAPQRGTKDDRVVRVVRTTRWRETSASRRAQGKYPRGSHKQGHYPRKHHQEMARQALKQPSGAEKKTKTRPGGISQR